ncbi:MAG: SDR family NAD(P)-dependent oxidoreductase, partial [Pseudomonadota bacterium]
MKLLEGKVALVVGGGQTPGETIGNGRATAIQFAREGARVVVADRHLESATETVQLIEAEGFNALAAEVDITQQSSIQALTRSAIDYARAHNGSLNILHNNVGVSLSGGDAPTEDITEAAFDGLVHTNLRGMVFTCQHVLPHMRAGG